ncbi:DUF551 domain-containing protein [Klebsiella pneumoniae]
MPPAQPVADSEPVAYMTYKGYLLHAGDPKLAEYSEPMPLYADPRPEPISAEPVAWLLSGGGAKNVVVFDSGNAYADPLREVTPLYRHAQPVTVVPDEVTAEYCPALVKYDVTEVDEAWARGFNACRAAVLQAKSLYSINPAPDLVSLQKKAESIIGNYPGIPDGWTCNDKANAALMMLDRIETVDPVDDDRIDGIKRIVRELAAAPHDTPALNSVQSVLTVLGKWIPVSERMPESNGVYFGWDGKRVLEVNCFFGGFSANQFIHGEITHWMPLPAAPQEVNHG